MNYDLWREELWEENQNYINIEGLPEWVKEGDDYEAAYADLTEQDMKTIGRKSTILVNRVLKI